MAEMVPAKDVLIVRDVELEREEAIKLAEETGALVLWLPDGGTVESMDEDEMRRHGWCRCDG